MTTKRIIIEQTDDDDDRPPQVQYNRPPYTNFDGFNDGFMYTNKHVGCSFAIAMLFFLVVIIVCC